MATAKINILDEPPDFSIVLGGPLFQLLRRTHLGGDHLELLYRRMIFFVGITWLPLFLLATVGPFAGSTGRLAFLRDIEVHARFLVALPALIAAELLIHLRMLPLARRFVECHIISLEDLPRFYRAVESAFGLRNSIPLELGLFVAVYTFWTVVLAWSFRDRSSHMVCQARRAVESYSGRLLVCFHKHSDSAVHS